MYIITDDGRLVAVNAQDVDLIDGRVPGRSSIDREHVIEHMRNGSLFKTEKDSQTRARLETRLLSIKSMIPTLRSYAADEMYLREIVKVLRLLLSPEDWNSGKRNITTAMWKIWRKPETSNAVLVEDLRDGEFAKLIMPFEELKTFQIQLQSLVLHVMRNGTKLGIPPKTEPGQKKVEHKEPTLRDLHLFAKTARTLGFRSGQSQIMLQKNVLRQTFEKCLGGLAPQDVWDYNMDSAVDKQCLAYQQIYMKKKPVLVPSPVPQDDSEVKLSRRYGRPVTSILTSDSYLFLRYLSNPTASEGLGVTSAFIRMEFFRRFWGPVQLGNEVSWEADTGGVAEMTGVDSVDTPSMYSDDGIANEWKLREEQEDRAVREKLNQAENQIEQYTSELERCSRESESLRKEGERKESYIKNLEAEVERGKKEIAQHTFEMSQKLQELAEIRKDNEAKDVSIKNLVSQAEADKMIIRQLPNSNDERLNNESMHSAREKVLLKQVQDLKQQSRTLRDENDGMLRQRKEEEEQVQTLMNQAAEKEQRLEGLKKRLKDAEDVADGVRRRSEEVTNLQGELHLKNEQISSLERRLHDLQSSNHATEEENGVQVKSPKQRVNNLEQQIQRLMRDIDTANLRRKTIKEQTEPIIITMGKMSKSKKTSDAQFMKEYSTQERRLRALQREDKKLETDTIPSLIKSLTNARYELLGLNGVEALFYERHPVTKDIISQTPTRVPLESGRLEAKFKNLKEGRYTVSYNKEGKPYYLGFDNFLEWKSCLADPPVAENATFYIEPYLLKRMAGENNPMVSKRAKHVHED
jgi:hypothetical protein